MFPYVLFSGLLHPIKSFPCQSRQEPMAARSIKEGVKVTFTRELEEDGPGTTCPGQWLVLVPPEREHFGCTG